MTCLERHEGTERPRALTWDQILGRPAAVPVPEAGRAWGYDRESSYALAGPAQPKAVA